MFKRKRQMSGTIASDRNLRYRSFLKLFMRNRVPVFLVLIATLFASAVTLLHDDALSPIDEIVYLDYTFKVDESGIVRQGESFGDEVAYVIACEGVVPHGDLGQECAEGAHVDLEAMPNEGLTTGHSYPPVYFWLTRLIGDPIHFVTGLSEVASWRLTGVMWLCAGLLAMVALFRRWQIPEAVTFTMGLVFIASPFTWWTYTYLSTDVSLFFFGTLTLLIVTDVMQGRQRGWWLIPVSIAGVLFKITNLLVLGLAVLVLILHLVSERIRQRKRNVPLDDHSNGSNTRSPNARKALVPLLVAIFLAAAAEIFWMKVFPLFAVSNVLAEQGISSPLSGTELARLSTGALGGAILHNPAAGFLPGSPIGVLYAPLGWLVVAGVVGAMMSFCWNPASGPLVWGTGIASVVALPALALLMYFATGSYFELPARYAAGLIPAILLVSGLMLRSAPMRIVINVYAGLMLLLGLLVAYYIGIRF